MSELLERLQAALGAAYHLERELGGGGMSRVFVAEETALGRRVVLKVLPPELGAGLSVDRFRREIQLAASLHHPNIVPLFAAGEADGLLYYTMPLIEGDSLRARLAREGELPVGETVRLLRDVVDALSCAHEHGVVHRDIKPDNVLITRHHALVTDFGVAKALSEATGPTALTSVGVALGTPAYMAPEQASGDAHVDHRADIYAVGALGYEMLTGRPPFIAPTPQAVLAAHVTQPPEPVARFRTSVPSSLAAVIMRCLEKRPADRWQTADELLHQLEAMATPSGGSEPTQAVAATTAAVTRPRGAGWVRWQRAGYLILGLVLALALAWGVARRRTGRAGEETGADKTIVVLPFENLGGPSDEYFADGITEEITNRLTGITGLKVIARSSAKQYKATQKPLRQIGEELGVGYVLEGTVRWERTGDSSSRVRVSPELIRVSDGTNVWARGYDAVMAGMFQVQSEIAQEVANALHVALAEPEKQAMAARPTANQEAYDYYLQGHAHLERDYSGPDLFRAVSLLEKAVALDSTFALAYADLARANDWLYWFYFDRTEERLARVKAAADRAVKLQPALPEARVAMAYYHYHGRLDYDRALEELELARQARPNDAEILSVVAFVIRRQGKWEEAYNTLARVIELDPRSARGYVEGATNAAVLGRYHQAEQWLQQAIAIFPGEPRGYMGQAIVAIASKGDRPSAQDAISRGLATAGVSQMMRVSSGLGAWGLLPVILSDSALASLRSASLGESPMDSSLGYSLRAGVAQREGRRADQKRLLDSALVYQQALLKSRPDEPAYRMRLAEIYVNQGRTSEAIREGEAAAALRPISKDALDGSSLSYALARIYAAAGQPDSALARLERLMAVPHMPPVTAAWLRVDTVWAALGSNPRFQKLLAGRTP
jgi:eukaryotic-like serine/threonine-protein kinase